MLSPMRLSTGADAGSLGLKPLYVVFQELKAKMDALSAQMQQLQKMLAAAMPATAGSSNE